jgi:hypothetical protein
MENNPSIMHNFNTNSSKNPFSLKFSMILVVIIFLGIGSGLLLSKLSPNLDKNNALQSPKDKSSVEKGKIYGSNDTSTFKDSVEGKLKEGGIEGEGQFHLERPGGISQNVYLTSSSVDLSLFIDRKIKVWGETQKAQKAGWLMDVGRVEVL